MGKINVLDTQIANLIAAGEVVDRPASVVKELLENSIDAGANSVVVEIKRGGSSFIRVSDDGCGISREDVPVCIRRHATSKIRGASDLDGITTLGFRGEALAAIGSVSTVRIMTKPHGEKLGTMLVSEAGVIKQITETGCMDGTTVIVEELFSNVPARRKFLKKDSSETMAVAAVVEKLALSRPEISFKFIADGALRFVTAGDGNLRGCIFAVLGREFSQRLTPVEELTSGIGVEGYIGTPDNVRANRNYQNFFINGRYVKSRTAMAALEQAFSSYIPVEKFPVCVLYITIHPAFVDVNVHPAKLEVKFSNEQAIFDVIYSAVRGALSEAVTRPSSLFKNRRDALREAQIRNGFVPLPDRGEASEGSVQLKLNGEVPSSILTPAPAPLPPPAGDEGEFAYPKRSQEFDPRLPRTAIPEPPLPLSFDTNTDGSIVSSSANTLRLGSEDETSDEQAHPGGDPLLRFIQQKSRRTSAERPPLITRTSPVAEKEDDSIKNYVRTVKLPFLDNGSDGSVSSLNRASAKSVAAPEYKMLGEVFNSYILAEAEGKLLMIDKHAAHERILFEDMKKNLRSDRSSQILLVPTDISLSPTELAATEEFKDELTATGYQYTPSPDGHAVSVTEIPAFLETDDAVALFSAMTEKLASGTGNVERTKNEFYEQALYQASCKAAIKAGRIYDEEHLKWICDRVLTDPAIRFCPHGRPVAFEISKSDIEHSFKRS